MKKIFTIIALMLTVFSTTAMAASVSDLVPINKNWAFIADEITSNGTAKPTANTLYCDGFIFLPQASTVSTSKGKSTFAGGEYLNSLRLKNTQDQLMFAVAQPCKVTFYTSSDKTRGIQAGTTAGGTELGVQPVSTTEWSIDIKEACTVYLSSFNGDFYFAGFEVSGVAMPDAAPTISVPTTLSGDTKHAIDIKATVDGSPQPVVQWYSNTTASNEGGTAIEGATTATYQFKPTAAGTYYFYATAENKLGKVTSSAVTVTVDPAYTVTYFKSEVSDVIGTAPAAITTTGKFTVPVNQSLYWPGYTLTKWTDGTTNYLPGQEYTISGDVTLSPVFRENTLSLKNVKKDTTVKYIHNGSMAATYQSSNKNAFVESVKVDIETIDAAIVVQGGKFDMQPTQNSGKGRAQTNNGTTVTIPVTKGATVAIEIYDNKDPQTFLCTIDGKPVLDYIDTEATGKVRMMTYVYEGDAETIDYVVGDANMYAYQLQVTYPVQKAEGATFEVAVDKDNYTYTVTPTPADAQYVTVAYNDQKFVYEVTGATNDAEFLATLNNWGMLQPYTGTKEFDLAEKLGLFGSKIEDGEVVIIVQEIQDGKLVGEPTVVKTEITAPVYEDVLGEATVKADSEGITISWENVSDAVKALNAPELDLSGIQFTVNGTDYYFMGSPEIDLEDGKFTITISYVQCGSNSGDKYEPKEGDEITVSILSPEIWYRDATGSWAAPIEQNDQEYTVTVVTSTGINSVDASTLVKAMYNLQGQRISNAKGIVIMNGKKVVVK